MLRRMLIFDSVITRMGYLVEKLGYCFCNAQWDTAHHAQPQQTKLFAQVLNDCFVDFYLQDVGMHVLFVWIERTFTLNNALL